MPKLYSSKEVIQILEKNGFMYVSQKGSHVKYRRTGNPTLTVIIPAERKQIPVGTFNSILRQSNLTKEDFE
jgi:predicted RNA binding protein YcfA (HicA-like mRNA interferase family)